MAKKKKSTAPLEPTKSQSAGSKHIQKLIEEAAYAKGHEDAKAKTRFAQRPGRKRPARDKFSARPPRAQLSPAKPIMVPVTTSLKPETFRVTSRALDPLTAANEPHYLINDKRHDDQGIILIEANHSPLVKLPVPTVQNAPRREPFRFLDLPFDIQSMVYDLVILRDHYQIGWVNGNQNTKSLTYRYPYHAGGPDLAPGALEHRRHFRRPMNAPGRPMLRDVYSHPSPVSLLWVCRTMYFGASKVFYNRSTFIFSRVKTLRYFLDTVRPANKEKMRSLKLIHHPYGHPKLSCRALWKRFADDAWKDICLRITTECPNLKVLDLDLKMRRCPISFGPLQREMIDPEDFTQHWMLALLPFKLLDFNRVRCQIRSLLKEGTVLEVESYCLRKELMGRNWKEAEEHKRDAYGYSRLRTTTNGATVLRVLSSDRLERWAQQGQMPDL